MLRYAIDTRYRCPSPILIRLIHSALMFYLFYLSIYLSIHLEQRWGLLGIRWIEKPTYWK